MKAKHSKKDDKGRVYVDCSECDRGGNGMDVHFSSKTDMWSTPQDTFDALAAEFGPFDIDVCATPENAKCPRYYTREDDGLAQPWTGRCFMNPPYGRTIGQWMRKAYEASQNGATVVCLVPARTDTAWFHSFVTKASQVRFLKGRLKFGGSANSAPFPSMIVVFRNAFDVAQGKVELFPSVQQVIRDPNPSVSGCGKFTESNSKFSLFEFSKGVARTRRSQSKGQRP